MLFLFGRNHERNRPLSFFSSWGEVFAILAIFHLVKSSRLAPFLSLTWQSVYETYFL